MHFPRAIICLIAVLRSKPNLQSIEENRVTRISLVPTHTEDILDYASLNSYDLSSIRKVATAGAALRSKKSV